VGLIGAHREILSALTLTLPEWFTVRDRRQIDLAIDSARALMVMEDLSLHYASAAMAVQGLLPVLDAIVQVFDSHRDQRADELRGWADDLHDQVMVWADAFAPAVDAALQTCPWWQTFQTSVREPVVAVKTRKRRDVARVKAEREEIVLPLLNQLEWTPTSWALQAGVDPSVTLGYLDGTSSPRTVHRSRIKYALAKALNLPNTFRLPD
jgi:hypothetical protein